jgi:hypothetical protein
MAISTHCADHCRRWMAARGLTYCTNSREAFARAHPALCGRAYEVTLRGYQRWLVRSSVQDELDNWATYLSARFDRALIAARLPICCDALFQVATRRAPGPRLQ